MRIFTVSRIGRISRRSLVPTIAAKECRLSDRPPGTIPSIPVVMHLREKIKNKYRSSIAIPNPS